MVCLAFLDFFRFLNDKIHCCIPRCLLELPILTDQGMCKAVLVMVDGGADQVISQALCHNKSLSEVYA